MTETEVTVRTPLHGTEKRETVEEAVLELFPDAEFEEQDGTLVARSETVERLAELVNRQEINDAVREKLHESVVGDTLVFRLSKQPAAVGKVSFDVGGHELGALRARIETDDVDTLIDELTRGN
jgi:predicted RNA binding protein with dsRBD fold (UPF0201 family)